MKIRTIIALIFVFFASAVSAADRVDPQVLSSAISEKILSVDEFRFIHQVAGRLGIRVYLFGGTAAGFAHYVKWDLLRKSGDQRFQAERFDYDFSNVYRSTQDADLVVDGELQAAEYLEQELANKYPHMQGSKLSWEVRLLREVRGDKIPLLNNEDFLNQHTDSHSVGMIEITDPPQNETRIKDLRAWAETEPPFLKDVSDGQLHFYFSKLHGSTSRAKAGLNPPILSVIRYFTKAFQYELDMRPEDLGVLSEIIRKFTPHLKADSYVANWIIKNAKNLVRHAVNIEFARRTLDAVGLREKLLHFDSENAIGSLSWWLNREPLYSKPIGSGAGLTAKEMKLDLVAHETRDFLAYESITRSHQGDANVLISRNNAAGEAAAHGDGFYVRVGKYGAANTGITIRFHLHPDARQNSDFMGPFGDYIVVKNKNALRVIPEFLNLSSMDYLNLLKDGTINSSDKGIQFKFDQRIARKTGLSESDKNLLLQEFVDYCKHTKALNFVWHQKVLYLLSRDSNLLNDLENAIEILIMRLPSEKWLTNSLLPDIKNELSAIYMVDPVKSAKARLEALIALFGGGVVAEAFASRGLVRSLVKKLEDEYENFSDAEIISDSTHRLAKLFLRFSQDEKLFPILIRLLTVNVNQYKEDSPIIIDKRKCRQDLLKAIYESPRSEGFFKSEIFKDNLDLIMGKLLEEIVLFYPAVLQESERFLFCWLFPDLNDTILDKISYSFSDEHLERFKFLLSSQHKEFRFRAYRWFRNLSHKRMRELAQWFISKSDFNFLNDLKNNDYMTLHRESVNAGLVLTCLIKSSFDILASDSRFLDAISYSFLQEYASNTSPAYLILSWIAKPEVGFKSEVAQIFIKNGYFWENFSQSLKGRGVSNFDANAWEFLFKHTFVFEWYLSHLKRDEIIESAVQRLALNSVSIAIDSAPAFFIGFILKRPELYIMPEFRRIQGDFNQALADAFFLENPPFSAIQRYVQMNPEVLESEYFLERFMKSFKRASFNRWADYYTLLLYTPLLTKKIIALMGPRELENRLASFEKSLANRDMKLWKANHGKEFFELNSLVNKYQIELAKVRPLFGVGMKPKLKQTIMNCVGAVRRLSQKMK